MATTRRKGLLAGLGALALAATVGLGAALLAPVGHDPVTKADRTPLAGTVGAALRSTIPADPSMVMIAPGTPQWWAYLTKMAPSTHLAGVDIAKAPVDTLGYAYAISNTRTVDVAKDVPTYAAVYIQTGSTADADTLTGWLATQDGAAYRRAYRTGTTVLVAPEWADRTEFTLDTTTTTAALRARIGAPDQTATWTWNIGDWSNGLADHAADLGTRTAVTDTFTALGITKATTVTVTAKNPTDPWKGKATGHNPATVDLNHLATALQNSDIVLAKREVGDKNFGSEMAMVQSGLSVLLNGGSFSVIDANGKGTTLGTGTPVNLLGSAAQGKSVSAQFDPSLVNNYALGHDTDRTTPVVGIQVDSAGNVALAPVFTTK